MTSILLTGFGPFPGAPVNPTERLVAALMRWRHPALTRVRRAAHIFRVSYDTVDRELPDLLARERPDILLMFGLATRSRHIRIEMLARNALSQTFPDASGHRAYAEAICREAPPVLALRVPAMRLLIAARSARMPAVLSRDAGRYLCNYLCWRVAETRAGAPRIAAFVHVPMTRRTGTGGALRRRPPFAHEDLVRAGKAIVLAALSAPPI